MGAFHCLILELRHGTHLKHGFFGILFIDFLISILFTQMVMQHAGPRLESYNIFLASNTSLMYVSSFLQPFVLVVFALRSYFGE